jgi:transcriptional regulator with GAF, ATPase, and Fis domain
VLRYPLRDIAGSLASAPSLESAVESLLVYLRALQPDWHPSLALYTPGNERFERVFQLDRGHSTARSVSVGLDQLPARLVRKYIRPSAFFNDGNRRSLLEKFFQQAAGYEPDRFEGPQLQPLTAPVGWRSCACLPLNDHAELLGLIVVVCPRPNGFGPAALEALQPLRGLASLAIARRLHATGRSTPESRAAEESAKRAAATMNERVRSLEAELERAIAESEARGATLQAVLREAERLRADSGTHDAARARAAQQTAALEEQIDAVGTHLSDACTRLAEAESRLGEMTCTLDVVREAFEVIAHDPDPASITRAFVGWFCERFQIGRLSVMRLDEGQGDLRIMAHQGMDPSMAARVRLRVGQGVAGWVASTQQSVIVRERRDDTPVRATGLDSYNSDSFISLPLVHRQRVVGVINMSNKQDGEAFDDLDLDRAQLASHVLALALGEALAA